MNQFIKLECCPKKSCYRVAEKAAFDDDTDIFWPVTVNCLWDETKPRRIDCDACGTCITVLSPNTNAQTIFEFACFHATTHLPVKVIKE